MSMHERKTGKGVTSGMEKCEREKLLVSNRLSNPQGQDTTYHTINIRAAQIYLIAMTCICLYKYGVYIGTVP